MKILVVHNAYQSRYIGGEDVVVQREIKGLKKSLGENNIFSYWVSNDDIKSFKLAQNIWGDKTHGQNIFNLIKKEGINIVHVHNFFPLLTPSVFEAAKTAGAKVVHTLHNFRWWCLAGTFYHDKIGTCEQCLDKSFAWPAVVNRCYRGSTVQSLAGSLAFAWYKHQGVQQSIDAYFALTQFQLDKCKVLLPPEKLWLKPNPIEPPNDPPADHPVDKSKNKKGYLFVGRLERAKGIDLLLSTWKNVGSEYVLTIIGEGENRALLSQQYAQENIRFLGQLPLESVYEYIEAAKYLIHPSLTYETFGLTLVEALARGTPVIGLNCGTRPEFIKHRENGFLFEEANVAQVIKLSDDFTAYAQLSQNARSSAQKFYAPVVIDQQVALYDQILREE